MNQELLNAISQINLLKRIKSVEWTSIDKLQKGDGMGTAVTIKDDFGNTAVILLHPPESGLHGLDHALIRIVTWVINMQNKGDASIPMGHISDMVNKARQIINCSIL